MDATPVNTSIIILHWQVGCTFQENWEWQDKIEDELSNIYVKCLWLAELKVNRKRTLNMNKLETTITCCKISWKSLFTHALTSHCIENDEIEQMIVKLLKIRNLCTCCLFSRKSLSIMSEWTTALRVPKQSSAWK